MSTESERDRALSALEDQIAADPEASRVSLLDHFAQYGTEHCDAQELSRRALGSRRRRFVRIVHRRTGEMGHESDVTDWSERQIERLIDGMSINLDHANYRTVDTAHGEG